MFSDLPWGLQGVLKDLLLRGRNTGEEGQQEAAFLREPLGGSVNFKVGGPEMSGQKRMQRPQDFLVGDLSCCLLSLLLQLPNQERPGGLC